VVADLAVALGVPISRLIAETGRAADYQAGNCGRLIRHWREQRRLSLDQLAEASGLSRDALLELESGSSPAERWMPILLGIAREIDQPLFNFFYPCGVPLRELDECL
jgi:transcriptional regulator with XRE-family HTH domain